MLNIKRSLLVFVAVSASALYTPFAQGQTGQPTKVVDGKTYLVHTVAGGETFYKIANKYGCTVPDLQAANTNIKVLHPGDQLLVPQKQEGTSQPREITPTVPAKQQDFIEHTVKKGETLSKIARDNNTTIEEIKKVNNLGTAAIRIGQIIKIPVSSAQGGTGVSETPKVPAQSSNDTDQKKTETQVQEKPKTEATPKQEQSNQPNTGMPSVPKVTVAETAVEKEEDGTATILANKMDQTRQFVMHPTLPKGSIIVIINEATGKFAYCRVVDNIRDSDLNGANIAITQAVAEKLGFTSNSGNVKIKYAAP